MTLFFVSYSITTPLSKKKNPSRALLGILLSLLFTVFATADTNNNNNNNNKNSSSIPKIQIATDIHGLPVEMPLVGAGTWQYNNTLAYQSLCKAFAAGYTFVDTAFGYGNQKGVAKAIKDCYNGRRDDLFVMTKIPGGLQTHQQIFAAAKQNLLELDLEYVDHLMLHFPADWEQKHASPLIRQHQWMVLEEFYVTGTARSLGISHYCPQHIDDILEIATIKPSINQVEYHVGSGDIDGVISKCQQHNITFMSFSPLCGPCQYQPKDSLISGDLVTRIAKKHNVTGSQVSLRYIVQQALQHETTKMGGVIPKSNNEKHIRSNMDLFRFELDSDDMKELAAADKPSGETGDCSVP